MTNLLNFDHSGNDTLHALLDSLEVKVVILRKDKEMVLVQTLKEISKTLIERLKHSRCNFGYVRFI